NEVDRRRDGRTIDVGRFGAPNQLGGAERLPHSNADLLHDFVDLVAVQSVSARRASDESVESAHDVLERARGLAVGFARRVAGRCRADRARLSINETETLWFACHCGGPVGVARTDVPGAGAESVAATRVERQGLVAVCVPSAARPVTRHRISRALTRSANQGGASYRRAVPGTSALQSRAPSRDSKSTL